MKQRYVVIYRMLDGTSLAAQCYYSEEEARDVMSKLEYAEDRDLIVMIDVEGHNMNYSLSCNVLAKSPYND